MRSKGDWAVLEGPHLVSEALGAGIEMEEVFATAEFLESRDGKALAPRLNGCELVETSVIATLGDADTPKGLLAIARLPRSGVDTLPRVAGGRYVYAESLQDPGNLGALARAAEAAGAHGLALGPGSAHPNHPRALRGSAGSLLRLPAAVGVAPDALAARLDVCAPLWVALVPRDGEDLFAAELEGGLVLLIGAEGPGLGPALLARAGRRITIPLAAPVESLNATVAAAVVLFELQRRQHS